MPNQPAIDYLRIATYDTNAYVALCRRISDDVTLEPGRWLQYKGRRTRDGTVFHGSAQQNHKHHHIVQFTGSGAGVWYACMLNIDEAYQFYATRIDVQVTIQEPEEHDARELYQAVDRSSKSIVQNPDTSTVYIGARTSDLFTRLYEKSVAADLYSKKRFLRCEFEIKGNYAKAAWGRLLVGDWTLIEIYNSCFAKAKLPKPWSGWFSVDSDVTKALDHQQEVVDLGNKLSWLKNTETALAKYIDMHDTQQATVSMIHRLNAYTRRLR